MPIFSSKTPAKLLVDAKAARDGLVERLNAAEIAVTNNRKAAEGLAVAGADDAKLDEAEAKTRAMVDRTSTLKAALAQSEVVVADLEKEIAEAADRALREKTGNEVELLARAISAAATSVADAATRLGDLTLRASVAVPEANGLAHFAQVCRAEIPAAGDLVVRLLRQHGEAVRQHRAAATLAAPPQPYIAPPVELKPPSMTLFTTHSVKWTADDGKLRTAPQFVDVTLPLKAARRGLQKKVLVQLTDPLRKQNHRGAVGGTADPSTAIDLDADEQPRLADPILQSSPQLTVIDRGPPIPMRVATRSSDETR